MKILSVSSYAFRLYACVIASVCASFRVMFDFFSADDKDAGNNENDRQNHKRNGDNDNVLYFIVSVRYGEFFQTDFVYVE